MTARNEQGATHEQLVARLRAILRSDRQATWLRREEYEAIQQAALALERRMKESRNTPNVSPTRDDGLEEAAKYCLLSADLSERNGHRPLAAAQRAMAEILRSMKSAGTRQCGMCGNWARLHLDVSRGRCYMDGGITLNSDGCEDWKPMIVVAADREPPSYDDDY